ncbi:MAG: hypothetical protein LW875_04020 [Proteobacteria bacterium]|nr:hypothetical protein [Pseudomonadota bacterium]
MALRQQGYKKSFLSPELARAFQNRFGQELTHCLRSWKKSASPADLCAKVLIFFFQKERPKLWKGSFHQDQDLQTLSSFSSPELEFFRERNLRALPPSVARVLCLWEAGVYHLELWSTIPTAEQVLDLQTQGRRCVSLLDHDWGAFPLGERDVFSFLIHDLIHADHFFKDPRLREAQMSFAQQMKNLLLHPVIQEKRQNVKWNSQIEYLIADMNTHPLHLMKTLKSLLMPELETGRLQAKDFQNQLGWSLTQWQAFARLNTPLEKGLEFRELLLQQAQFRSSKSPGGESKTLALDQNFSLSLAYSRHSASFEGESETKGPYLL